VEVAGVENAEEECRGGKKEEDLLWKAKYGVKT